MFRPARKMLGFFGLLILSGCLTAPKTIAVTQYKGNKVYLGANRFYQVGPLSNHWKRKSDRLPGISFYHEKWNATIATDAVCEPGNNAAKPDVLVQQRLSGLSEAQILKQSAISSLGNAVEVWVRTKEEAKTVFLDLVVIQAKECQFEFAAIMPDQQQPAVEKDFEQFFGGFHF